MGSPKEELQARIAAAQAKRKATDTANAERRELEALEREAAAAEQAAEDAEAVAKFEIEIGPQGKRIMVVETDMGAIVLQRPPSALYKLIAQLGEEATRDQLEDLARKSHVYPNAERFEQILTDLPNTLPRLLMALGKLQGSRAEDILGKA
jgi:hypothetical protein